MTEPADPKAPGDAPADKAPGRYADKKWRRFGPARAMAAAQRIYEELHQDMLDFDSRKPEDAWMDDEAFKARMVELGQHLRGLWEFDKITDAAELKRRGRVFLGIPSRLKRPKEQDE